MLLNLILTNSMKYDNFRIHDVISFCGKSFFLNWMIEIFSYKTAPGSFKERFGESAK